MEKEELGEDDEETGSEPLADDDCVAELGASEGRVLVEDEVPAGSELLVDDARGEIVEVLVED